jgi:hypothetical protein
MSFTAEGMCGSAAGGDNRQEFASLTGSRDLNPRDPVFCVGAVQPFFGCLKLAARDQPTCSV